MRKIVFLDQCLEGGGAERVLCTIMRALDPRQFEVHLILVTELRDLRHLVPDSVAVHELGVTNTRKALPAFSRKIKGLRPDVVFTTTGRTGVLAAMGRLTGGSYRWIARYPNMPSRQIQSGALRSWRRTLTQLLFRSADVVIAQSEEMAKELFHYFKLKPKKVQTLTNPLDREQIACGLKGALSPFDPTRQNWVAAGRLVDQKGFDVLLKAFAEVHSQHPSARLHLLGADFCGNRQRLEQQAESLGIREKVVFHGFVSNPYPYYKYCDLFILSSRWEGCPNALLEALYLGRRAAATRCVPIIERLVDPAQGTLAKVNDPQSLAQAIREAQSLPETDRTRRTAPDSIAEFIDLIESQCATSATE